MKKDIINCTFCNQNIKERTVVTTCKSIAFIAKHSLHKGQLLVIPKRHIEDFAELSPEEISDIFMCAQKAIIKLKAFNGLVDYNLILNQGEFAGQTISHIHLHVIPRENGDTSDPKYLFSPELFKKLKENSTAEMIHIAKEINDCKQSDDELQISKEAKFIGKIRLGVNVRIDSNVIIGQVNYKKQVNSLSDNIGYDVVIGDNAIIRSGSVIYNNVTIGNDFDCGHNSIVREGCILKNNVYIFSNTLINSNVKIGNNCRIYGFICNNALLQDNVSMHGNLVHKYDNPCSCIIEDSPVLKQSSTIGIGATIIGGVKIGENSYVGAGSVVTSDISPNDKVVGNPAKSIKSPVANNA